MESTKEVLVVKSANLLNENSKITGGFGGGIVGGSPLFPLPKLTENFGRNIKFSIKAGAYSLRTFVGDSTVTKENCLGIYLHDSSGEELQGINSLSHNAINSTCIFTVSEEVASKTTQLYIFFNHDVAGTTYEEDNFNGIMINIGETAQDYEPYYLEYESAKEILVRRSNNLLYFPSNLNNDLYKVRPFRNKGITFTKTLDDVHLEGEWDGTENTSGAHGVAYCNIALEVGTYTLTTDENYQGQCLLNKKVDNAWVTIAGCTYGAHTKTFTITETTVIGRVFWSNGNMDKNVPIDMWMHPMLVEGDTAQDYEPYYYEAEASKTGIIPDDGSLTSIVDFSTAIKDKRLKPEDGVTLQTNTAYAYVPEYYSCEEGDIFKFTYVGQEKIKDQNYRQNQIMWYDVNKNFLSFEAKNAWSPITFSAAPANAKFFRINYSGLYLAKIEWMLPSNPKLTKVTS